jgi:tight adherence protein B
MTILGFGTYDLIFGAVVFAMALVVFLALFGARVTGEPRLEQRLARMGLKPDSVVKGEDDEQTRAREALNRALAELEAAKRRDNQFFLRRLLVSSGTDRSLLKHVALTLALMLGIFAGLWLIGTVPVVAAVLGVVAGLLLPILHLRFLTQRRLMVFANDLPGALDLIVRGIRAGLPLLECLRMVVDEWEDPLRSEFQRIMGDMGMGLSIRDAVARFADRVPIPEARLFSIVISLQAQSGGNLSEVLSNLAEVLREKGKLLGKIRAMTSEARASALIIGSIPVLMAGVISVMSPGFLAPLFNSLTGNIVLALCGAWMVFGMLVMRAMMKVDL